LHLDGVTKLDGAIKRALAEAFDPDGKSKWKLQFKRLRKGNPQSELRTELQQALIANEAQGLRTQAEARGTEKNWERAIYPQVQRKLERDAPRVKTGKSSIRAARTAAKRAKRK
jgi:hypothetical protein